MNESKVMKQLHLIREKNYATVKNLSVKEQIKTIQAAAAPVKERFSRKMRAKEVLNTGGRNV